MLWQPSSVYSVNSKALTSEQIKGLATLRCYASWLDALPGRMHQRHFPHDDPLKRATEDAFAAVQRMKVEIERLG